MKNLVPNSSDSVLFICTSCGFEEMIPKDVVDFFDIMDGGVPSVPPTEFYFQE